MYLSQQQIRLLAVLRWIHPALIAFVAVTTGAVSELMAIFLLSAVIWWFDLGRKLLGSRSSGTALKSGNIKDFIGVQFRALRIKYGMKRYITEHCTTHLRDGEENPWAVVREYRETTAGWRITVHTDTQRHADEMVSEAGHIARSILGRDAKPAKITSPESCVVVIDLMLTDPLTDITHQSSFADRNVQLSAGVPVALDDTGKLVRLSILESNILLGGIPGSGKSGGLSAILAGLAPMENVALIGIDPKKVELSAWKDRFSYVATDLDDAERLLENMLAEMDRRYDHLVSSGKKKFTEADFTYDMPMLVLVCDELAEIVASGTTSAETKADKVRASHLRRLVAKGRAAGICEVLATQKPSSDVVPTGLRDIVAQRASFATMTPDMTDTILGAGSAKDSPAHQIPASSKGECFVLTEGDRIARRSRFFWVPDDDCSRIARDTAHLRVDLPWLSS